MILNMGAHEKTFFDRIKLFPALSAVFRLSNNSSFGEPAARFLKYSLTAAQKLP